jgi:hypothetical protein
MYAFYLYTIRQVHTNNTHMHFRYIVYALNTYILHAISLSGLTQKYFTYIHYNDTVSTYILTIHGRIVKKEFYARS